MEEVDDLGNPTWLKYFLEAKFYENKCKDGHYKTKFCIDCKSRAFCKCEENHQANHQVLDVFRASSQPTIRINVIRKLLDISCIQPCSVNKHDIVYINKTGARVALSEDADIANCEMCKIRIKEGYSYCSLLCKVKANKRLGIKSEEDNHKSEGRVKWLLFKEGNSYCSNGCQVKADDESLTTNPLDNDESRESRNPNKTVCSSIFKQRDDQPTCSSRKRRRRGIPQRSPLF